MNLKDPAIQEMAKKAVQGNCTKAEAANAAECVEEMFEAIPKSKRMEFIGHLNDVFLGAAYRNLPDPKPAEPK